MKINGNVIKKIIKEELSRILEDQDGFEDRVSSHDEENIFHDEPPGYAKSFINSDDLYNHFDLDQDGKVSIEDYIASLESYLKRPEVLDALKMQRYTKKKIYDKSNVLDTGRYLRSTQYHKPGENMNNPAAIGIPSGGKTFDIG